MSFGGAEAVGREVEWRDGGYVLPDTAPSSATLTIRASCRGAAVLYHLSIEKE